MTLLIPSTVGATATQLDDVQVILTSKKKNGSVCAKVVALFENTVPTPGVQIPGSQIELFGSLKAQSVSVVPFDVNVPVSPLVKL